MKKSYMWLGAAGIAGAAIAGLAYMHAGSSEKVMPPEQREAIAACLENITTLVALPEGHKLRWQFAAENPMPKLTFYRQDGPDIEVRATYFWPAAAQLPDMRSPDVVRINYRIADGMYEIVPAATMARAWPQDWPRIQRCLEL